MLVPWRVTLLNIEHLCFLVFQNRNFMKNQDSGCRERMRIGTGRGRDLRESPRTEHIITRAINNSNKISIYTYSILRYVQIML